MRLFFYIIFTVCCGSIVHGQTSDLPVGHHLYGLHLKQTTLSGTRSFTTVKPFGRDRLLTILADSARKNEVKQFNAAQAAIEFWDLGAPDYGARTPMLKWFYQQKSNFYSYQGDDLIFHINPVWDLQVGSDNTNEKLVFVNGRGLELSGTIDERVSFYSFFTENQAEYPTYVKNVADSIGVIPLEGFWKEYGETTTDYFRVFGHVNVQWTDHIQSQLGYGRQFIGNGERSLFLSDFSNSHPYLRNSIEVWRIKYTNSLSKLTADVFTYYGGNLGSKDYPNKFLNFHYVDFAITDNFNLGIFESVMYGRADSLGGSRPKMEYQVPFTFLRAVEQQDGSTDNSLLGLEAKLNVMNRGALYGQFVLDDFSISELKSGNNWWGNKFGYQIGAHIYDLPIENFDIQVERNWIRPFTYAHENLLSAQTHYLQPLAHPMGANLKEWIIRANYQPIPRLTADILVLMNKSGSDVADSVSFGSNPLKSYNLRQQEYGHEIGQGLTAELFLTQSTFSYQLFHNFFIDLSIKYRVVNGANSGKSTILTGGFRWNAVRRNYLF
ncbi:MAG: hypothetical protein JXQ90_13160 [Cyclobacteriaceae bacterium]